MDAFLRRYGSKRILDICYSTATDGHDWERMVAEAKIKCNVGQERVQVIFSQSRTRKVMHG